MMLMGISLIAPRTGRGASVVEQTGRKRDERCTTRDAGRPNPGVVIAARRGAVQDIASKRGAASDDRQSRFWRQPCRPAVRASAARAVPSIVARGNNLRG